MKDERTGTTKSEKSATDQAEDTQAETVRVEAVRMPEAEIRRRLASGADRPGADRPEGDQTDYERLARLTDEEIEEAAGEDPDAVVLEGEALRRWFETARRVVPGREKEKISIRLDEDVLSFFRAGGRGYQGRINDVLRAYVLTQRLGR